MQVNDESIYRPSDNEVYMSVKQLDYFREQLLREKGELEAMLAASRVKLRCLRADTPDPVDQSLNEAGIAMELRDSERYQAKLKRVQRALERIDEGSFGYCVITGAKIGLKRLAVQPFATLSVEAQELVEMAANASGHAGNNGFGRGFHFAGVR